jgi:predicted pyridoxine 5'-phosphate oxidase superfamily flavin-nucleotide-binding protein
MAHRFSDLTFTPSVEAMQRRFGSFEKMRELREKLPDFDHLNTRERGFIQERDSFYLATVSENGWPYIQHRGGVRGFLRVISSQVLAFANYAGNKQYQSLGNIAHHDKVALFLVDYPNKRRLKLLGTASIYVLAELPEHLLSVVSQTDEKETIESIVEIHLEAFDWNCSQHLMPRFSEEQWLEREGLTQGDIK